MRTVRLPSIGLRVPTLKTLREVVLIVGGFVVADVAAYVTWGLGGCLWAAAGSLFALAWLSA